MLYSSGLKPQLHVLDNECSQHLNDYILEENEGFQLVPPHLHRQNAAERSIQTFKNHFIAGLVSTHDDFPLHFHRRYSPLIFFDHRELILPSWPKRNFMANLTTTPLLLPHQAPRSLYTSILLSAKVGKPKEEMAGMWI